MAGCSSSKVEDKALDALEKGINKIVEMKTAGYSIQMDSTTGEEKNSMKLYGGYLADTAKPSFTATVDMTSKGSNMEGAFGFYLKDNEMYISMIGMKQKTTLEDAEDAGVIPKELQDIQNFKLDKEQIKPYLRTAKLSGDTLTMELDPEKITEELKKQAEKTEAVDASELTYDKFNITATIKDDFITKAVIDIEGTQTDASSSKEQKISGNITIEFTDINAGKELSYPDLSGYVDSAK